MPSANEIRASLRKYGEARALAAEMHTAATNELKKFLQAAQKHPEISILEAAKLGQISRTAVYKFLDEEQ